MSQPILLAALQKFGAKKKDDAEPAASRSEDDVLTDVEAAIADFDAGKTPRERARALLAAIELARE